MHSTTFVVYIVRFQRDNNKDCKLHSKKQIVYDVCIIPCISQKTERVFVNQNLLVPSSKSNYT